MGNIFGVPESGLKDADALRQQAWEQAQLRDAAFERSKQCYAVGDHAGAKHWSDRRKSHAANVVSLNKQAAAAIYKANNASRPPDDIDLHGLHVSEAILHADRAIVDARQRGSKRLIFIVGRGLHSADGVARIKPMLTQQLVTKHSLRVTPGVPNEGCLLVELVEPTRAGWIERLGCVIC